ncbi:MAG: glycosyltransferase family 4 protein, partial [Anaerolineaceae bacterium]|nr:glycosyltransferase family 4 protein [Anaerolineaceae bacterium]
MHILLIHQAFATFNEPGGTRHYEFVKFLAKKGHQVSIIASPVSYLTGKDTQSQRVEREMEGKISIYRAYTYHAFHKSFFHRLFCYFSFMVSSFFIAIKIKKVDIVWGTSPPIFQSFTAWLVSKLKRVPFLLEIRDLWPAFAVAVGVLKNKLLISLSLWLERFLYHHADRIIVNSPGYIKHVQLKGGKNVTLIPNGSDTTTFTLTDTTKIRKYFGWENTFILLYAGAHGMSNDLSVVLQAAKLIEKHNDIRFVFIGDGKEKGNLITLAESLRLSNVEFLNPVPKNKIVPYMQAADVCIAILKPVELYKTTYPNKVFDYMAAGKPIILAIDGVIREVVESAGCGIFCEPGNPQAIASAVLEMFGNRNRLAEIGK